MVPSDVYEEGIEQFLNDEGGIVTYRSLSVMFDVDTNLAKQMLYHYVKQQELKNKMDGFNITYFVSGVTFKNKSMPKMHKVMVVQGKNLEKIKNQFEEVVSVHIYSIQKTKLKDLNTLYSADCDRITDDIFSATKHSKIKCELRDVRTEVKTKLSDQRICQSDDEFQQMQMKKPGFFSSKKKTDLDDITEEKNEDKFATKQQKKQSIALMFATQKLKEDVSKAKGRTTDSKASQKAANKGSKKESMKSYMNKISSPQKKSLVSLAPPSNAPAILDSPPLKQMVTTQNSVADNTSAGVSGGFCKELKQESVDEGVDRGKKARSSNRAILSKSKHDMKSFVPSAKRNRIMQLDDSESSDNGEKSGDEENPFTSSPSPPAEQNASTGEDPVPPSPQDRPSVDLTKGRDRTRKRKLVDKTFMDDHGFLVTKREHVYFSCSDDEEPPLSKKKVVSAIKTETKVSSDKLRCKSSPKKMRKSPIKKKQSSIMNFFKKQ